MEAYKHKVCYYETDKMGITHHSNYIRWMEEARVDFLEKIGFGYDKLEEMGIMSPVIGIECDHHDHQRNKKPVDRSRGHSPVDTAAADPSADPSCDHQSQH